MDEWMDGWMDKRMDGWTDGRMDGYLWLQLCWGHVGRQLQAFAEGLKQMVDSLQ
jgi:hypothetical protein